MKYFIKITMIEDLIKTECIRQGIFSLKGGNISKYYFDIKSIVSHPWLLKKIGDAVYSKIPENCNLLCLSLIHI